MAADATENTSTNVEYIGSNVASGMSVGYATSNKVSCYGVTPVTQAAAVTGSSSDLASTTVIVNQLVAALKGFGITA